jgi:hypothetical protein
MKKIAKPTEIKYYNSKNYAKRTPPKLLSKKFSQKSSSSSVLTTSNLTNSNKTTQSYSKNATSFGFPTFTLPCLLIRIKYPNKTLKELKSKIHLQASNQYRLRQAKNQLKESL